MIRVIAIVVSVGLLMATGVAGASQVRLPVTQPTRPNAEQPTAESVVVARGDHLWKISARHLGDEASDHEIAPYWRDVVEVNRPHLESGDPDLIYPGEVVELPAIRARR